MFGRYIEPIYRTNTREGRRMIELAILGLLKEHPMHGYQLNRELSEQLGGLWRVSYGSLYPSLRRLERSGAISSEPGGGSGARRKTVYAITDEGERLFLELLQEPPHEGQTEDTRFRVRMAFFRYLPPETRVRVLERRRQGLQERLAEVKAHLRDPAVTDNYQRALMEHARAATEADIAWLTDLIQIERRTYEITAPVGEQRRASATLRRKERTR
ncbi:MAG TPA: PadR family transcriptional regulator [Actinomycetota bacterium]|nr:PadR family transcriptional regulator [Actinomycetota bacterium]